ncbi:MAG: SDR family NAD(P)-dependent oxidoreductase [Chthonomonas sp.]|nr:SDR family NAD(P)-dependent oxidoreductase [Chthonomonas sp.]
MLDRNPARAIVVGASSGLGLEIARQLLEAGWRVALLARNVEPMMALGGDSLVFEHDVTDFAAIPALFLQVTQELGGLDAVFYVAGVMPAITHTEYNFEKDSSMIQVNCMGAVAWLNEAATRFSRIGEGTIIAIGSVAGERGRLGQPVYNASKSFVNTYTESLRNRLPQIKVTTFKPGPVETPLTAHLDIKKMSVEVAARKVIAGMHSGRELFLSPVHKVIFTIIRNIPSGIFRRLKL